MALNIRKGLGDTRIPKIPWARLAKLTKSQKILIVVVILGALWGSFVWFLYMPQKEQIDTLKRDLLSAQDQLKKLRDVERNLRAFKNRLKETEAKFKQALQLLPDNEEIPSLLSSISNLGANSGLEFLLFQPQKEVAKNFYAEIPLKLEVSGPYHNVAVFFDEVSRLSRIVNIGDIKMQEIKQPKGSMEQAVVLKTDCTATTYKFIETKEPPKKGRGKKKK